MEKNFKEMVMNIKEIDKHLKDMKELAAKSKKENKNDLEELKKSMNKLQRSIDRALILFGTLLVASVVYLTWNWKIFNFILIIAAVVIYLFVKY